MMTMKARPSQLLFTQDSIQSYFSNGNEVNGEIKRIKSLWSWNRSSAIQNYLPLEVATCRYDGKLYCNNNRRLYMFRVLEKEGYVTEVDIKHGGLRPKAADVGCHVRMRGGENPLPHCPCGDSCRVM